MRRVLFWGSIGLIFYAYLGFPLLLLVRGLLRRRLPGPPVTPLWGAGGGVFDHKTDITPRVSLVIVAYNEAKTIGAKLDNVLALDYPADKLEIIVASDGSDDGTNEIVAGYAGRGVQFLAFPRSGKIPALNQAVARASGEILVFSDANSMYTPDALRALMRPFADASVGAVGGNQCYVSNGLATTASSGERLYWNFDRLLKTMQSQSGNMISATGAIHAIRRELFRPVPLGVGDDFVISTRAISQGYRLVFEPKAIAYETLAPTDEAEFQRKVRVIVRGLRGLWAVRELFNPFQYGFYAVQIFSHKLLRWSVGWLMLILLGVSLSLYRAGDFYRLIAQGQLLFYGSALGALGLRHTSLRRLKAFKLLSLPFYFCMANLAAIRAWLQLFRGKQIDLWNSNRSALSGEASSTGEGMSSEFSVLSSQFGVNSELRTQNPEPRTEC